MERLSFVRGSAIAICYGGIAPEAERAPINAESTGCGKGHVQGPARLFRAIILVQQSRLDEARDLIAKAEAQMRPLRADKQHPLRSGGDHDDVIFWLAGQEAKTVFATTAKSSDETHHP